MLWFWILLFILITFFLFIVLNRKTRLSIGLSRQELNKTMYQQRLAEIDQDLSNNIINQALANQLKVELQKNLLSDADSVESYGVSGAQSSFAVVAMISGLALAFIIYIAGSEWKSYIHWQDLINTEKSLTSDPEAQSKWMESLSPQELMLIFRTKAAHKDATSEEWVQLAQVLGYVGAEELMLQSIERAQKFAISESTELSLVQMLLMFNSEATSNKASNMLSRVLHQNPNHESALTFSGFLSFQKGLYAQAIQYWQRVISLRELRGESTGKGIEMLKQQIAQAEQMEAIHNSPKVDSNEVRLDVSLSEQFKHLSPKLTVFVIALGDDGMPAPVAVKRFAVADLPISVTLTDVDAMIPTRKLSQMDSIKVSARISLSGMPKAETGDITSDVVTVTKNNTEAIPLVINMKIN